MSTLEEFQVQYETGYKVFEKLFQLSDKELKEKLKSIIGSDLDKWNDGILGNDSGVERKISNEKYKEITICFYDWISISPMGIYYHPEHGEARKMIEFNKHFAL